MIFPFKSKDAPSLIRDLELKASEIKSYYYERTTFKKDGPNKEEKEMFVEGEGLKGRSVMFFPDGTKKEQLWFLTKDYIKQYDLHSNCLNFWDISQLEKDYSRLLNQIDVRQYDIRKPFHYGGVSDDNPLFLGERLIDRGVRVYLFQTKFEKLDREKKELRFYKCRVYVDKRGFLRKLSLYEKNGELIYEEKITKIIKNPAASFLKLSLDDGDFQLIDKTFLLKQRLEILKELKN
jgi:hypothetical protein